MKAASAVSEATSAAAAELFTVTAKLLYREALYLSEKYSVNRVVMAGGAASSRTIRRLLTDGTDPAIEFGDPLLSGDNAVGTARLAKRMYETGNSIPGK